MTLFLEINYGVPMYKFILLFLLLFSSNILAEDYIHKMELPSDVRKNYTNYGTGSCVFMSIGITGRWAGNNNAASCPWDSEYGSENVGGATPSRVAKMARDRKLSIYNVTANDYKTMREWFIWSVNTGRYAAIGAGSAHFQTLYGYNKDSGIWYVCNNNSPQKIDEYSEEGFRHLHEASGYWAVFLIGPPSPAIPQYLKWWE